MKMEVYFVTSGGDYPEKIFFTKKLAFESMATYVDTFDENGNYVNSYKLVDDEYITAFEKKENEKWI
jgi:hypothetical protein